MKFIGILLLLVAVVAIEASPHEENISLVGQARATTSFAAYKCKVDDDCPRGYGCRCDEFTGVCIKCKECSNDKSCRDKYSNPDSSCKCTHNLCEGCVA